MIAPPISVDRPLLAFVFEVDGAFGGALRVVQRIGGGAPLGGGHDGVDVS
jgi:hypothetical protein